MVSGGERVVQGNEGVGSSDSKQEANSKELQRVTEQNAAAEPGTVATDKQVPFDISKLSPKQLKAARGQFFTVKHILLKDCEHKMDVLNEPRHRNCDNCWFNFFNTHPALIDTVNDAWRDQGKAFIIKLRGRQFAKQFGRFMKTVTEMAKEGKVINVEGTGSTGQVGVVGIEPALLGDGTSCEEVGAAQATLENREAESDVVGNEVDEQRGGERVATEYGQESGSESSVDSD